MSGLQFKQTEVMAAIGRGVRQCVLIGDGAKISNEGVKKLAKYALEVFAVSEQPAPESLATQVPTRFESQTLAAALENSAFDKLKPALFVWMGAGYRTMESVMSTFAYIATLPKGSGVIFDYIVERTSLAEIASSALDAVASRIGSKYLIHPQAVSAMLNGLGFRQIVDVAAEQATPSGHWVSALV